MPSTGDGVDDTRPLPPQSQQHQQHRDQRQLYENLSRNNEVVRPSTPKTPKTQSSTRQPPASPYSTATIDLQSILGKSYSPKVPTSSSKPPVTTSSDSLRRKLSNSNSGNSTLKDGLGNLNRWSQSTASSKESPANPHKRSTSFGRRISFGASSVFKFASNSESKPSESVRSQTRIASTSSVRPSNSSPKQVDSLPSSIIPSPISVSHRDTDPALIQTAVTPSTAGLINAAVRNTVPDYFGRVWDAPETENDRQVSSGLQTVRVSGQAPEGTIATSLTLHAGTTQRPEESQGHSRHRSTAGKSSGGTLGSDLSESSRVTARGNKPPSQKAMLSKALQKANTAVLLDNAQNFEGAMEAYTEACNLLHQVMIRSSGIEDRRKLEAIRNTYTSRIQELGKIAPDLLAGKQLPARPESKPESSISSSQPASPRSTGVRDSVSIETATVAHIVNDASFTPDQGPRQPLPQVPERRPLSQSNSRQSVPGNLLGSHTLPAMNCDDMPPPLSPGRLPSDLEGDATGRKLTAQSSSDSHSRNPSVESMSWLDTINESGSASSSVHSRTSSFRVRRKHIRTTSGATEAEFDAALDAAVEAAYDDGLEIVDPYHPPIIDDYDNEVVLDARRRVERAKEMVRQTELESEREVAIRKARDQERARILKQDRERMFTTQALDGDESEEEERMLEEMTRGYIMDDFEFDVQNKSALPRESDSSGFSARTWNSSLGSLPTTGMTENSLSPEIVSSGQGVKPPFRHAPPVTALPSLPGTSLSAPQTNTNLGARTRRLSGHNPKQLSIETLNPPIIPSPSVPLPDLPSSTLSASNTLIPSSTSQQPLTPGLSPGSKPASAIMDTLDSVRPSSPQDLPSAVFNMRNGISSQQTPDKKESYDGLRGTQVHKLSISIPEDEQSAVAASNIFGGSPDTREPEKRIPTMPTLPTPMATAYKDRMNGVSNSGMFFLNNDLNSPDGGNNTSSMPSIPGGPIPLEPCPKSFLLRPFWLMRALYQTIAHPRGGYLSTKLFIPRDVWRVKGVKLKGVEDKIAVMDYLTSALQNLARVDINDADLVLVEMQSLESVLEQIQVTLSKKLGADVGVQASSTMFKDAENSPGIPSDMASGSKTPSSSRSTFSWKRLRTKTSSTGLATGYSSKATTNSTNLALDSKDVAGMASLPMTSMNTVRFARRDLGAVNFSGPNAAYMASLARLFDIAQVVDQIARQVEDPGLRHADKTQVGLELSTRHAAEFFGFYICRFVLADIGLLLDKFIKRGSEWVIV